MLSLAFLGEQTIACDSDDERAPCSTDASPAAAQEILKRHRRCRSVQEKESLRAQLAELGGAYHTLSRGSPVSLWTVYPTSSQSPQVVVRDEQQRRSSDEKVAGAALYGCRSPIPKRSSRKRERSVSARTSATPPRSPSALTPASLSLSQAERSAADWLTRESEGAVVTDDWRMGESQLSPCAIYTEESLPLPGKNRERQTASSKAIPTTPRDGCGVLRRLQFSEDRSEAEKTSVASAVIRQYNERTKHRLALECLAIPY